MSGKTVFRNIMGILLPGVNSIITERTSQIYGPLLEKAVQLSLEIIILVLEKDLFLSDYWRPLYQVKIFSMLESSLCFFIVVRIIVFWLPPILIQAGQTSYLLVLDFHLPVRLEGFPFGLAVEFS